MEIDRALVFQLDAGFVVDGVVVDGVVVLKHLRLLPPAITGRRSDRWSHKPRHPGLAIIGLVA